MKVEIVNDPSQVRVTEGYFQRDANQEFVLDEEGNRIWVEGSCRVMREDVDAAKDFARELLKEENPRIRQKWEHAYYAHLKER